MAVGVIIHGLKENYICIVRPTAVIQRGRHCYKKIQNYCQKNILKSGKKPVATNLYGNDAYMIHFQTYGDGVLNHNSGRILHMYQI
jgi:hypothetical protein